MTLKRIKRKIIYLIKKLFDPFYNVGKRFFFPPKIPINTNGKVLLHLGCGSINNPQFINIDAANLPHVHYVQDIRNLAVLPSNFADLLYSSHALEHISHLEVPKTLKEWARVIKKGGTIRLSVPDFDKMVGMYHASENNMRSIEAPLMG
ncbi:MAG: methyltransferase domain-containing protein, partial [Minisyncoccia bacterium]